jgi:hypothetical protein
MLVRDLPESALLIQDSQDRLAVLESIGLAHLADSYPTLFVEVGEGEYRRVWGIERFVPYLDEPVTLLSGAPTPQMNRSGAPTPQMNRYEAGEA